MLRRLRQVLAVISIVAVTLLFFDFTGTSRHLWGWMARIQFMPALLALNLAVLIGLLITTLLLGRVYCSVVCPLGILQDTINRISIRFSSRIKRKSGRFHYTPEHRTLRIIFLILFFAGIIAGMTSIAALIAPYSAYGRIISQLGIPVYDAANNVLADIAQANDSYAFYHVEQPAFNWPLFIVAIVTLAVVGIMAWLGGRTYCNTVCPVGTILGYISKFALLRPEINTDTCNNCGRCARNCKASCIDPKAHKIDYTRCVACFDCMENCSTGALTYRLRTKTESKPNDVKHVDASRRNFISMATILAGAAAASAEDKIVDGGLAPIAEKKAPTRKSPIAPPGARSVAHLRQHCTACQLCISACPNDVLRPSAELDSFMQPVVGYERGYCRPECTECSSICPDGAIHPITAAEKSSTSIGYAVVDADSCLSVSMCESCGNCARHCPAGAISMIEVTRNGKKRTMPYVNGYCIGCGACENLCPVRPLSAIHVEGREIHTTL